MPKAILLPSLRLALRHPAAFLWTYAFNLGLAFLFSLRPHSQLAAVLDHSLAAERLNSAFDLGTLVAATNRLHHDSAPSGVTSYLGLPLYFLIYFLIVPGTLAAYQSPTPARLSTLISTGIDFFWRFVRITLVTLPVSAAILGPLAYLQSRWSDHVDSTYTGLPAFLYLLPGILVIALAAALLRLYFDLVEVHTIHRSPDRRIRLALLPALRTLARNLPRALGIFLLLALLGLAALIFTGRIAAHTLAQPRVWPLFLLAQTGLFLILFTRFWQRAAETLLVLDNPLTTRALLPIMDTHPPDPQPDPEPAPPSLPEPDPGVFHHDPATPPPTPPAP